MQPAEEHPRHNEPRCLFCRLWFGMALVGLSACAGVAFFFGTHLLEEYHPKDFWFYLRIYAGIGAATGLLSWYLGRLVALQRLPIPGVALVLVFPLGIMLYSSRMDAFYAVIGVAVFGTPFLVACVAAALKRRRDAGGGGAA